MPGKGRSDPCHDPMKKGHSLKRQGVTDVRTCQKPYLDELRKYLPEYNWRDGTRMCIFCRGQANRQIQARMKVKKTVKKIADGIQALLSEEGENKTNAVHMEEGQAPGESSRTISGAPLSPIASGEDASSSCYPTLPSGPCLSGHEEMLSDGDSLSPSAPIAFNIPETPTRQLLVPLSVLTPTSVIPSTSHSVTPSGASVAASQASGSVFHNEAAAKYNLHRFLHNIGVSPPEGSARGKKKFFTAMGKAKSKLEDLFKEFAGGQLPEDPTACECKHCALIVNAVKVKLELCKLKKEKYMMLTTLPNHVTIAQMNTELGVTKYVARTASKLRNAEGPFSYPLWKPAQHALSESAKAAIYKFYNCNENSRVSPNARDTIRIKNMDGKYERVAKRVMLANMKDSFMEFKRTHPDVKAGISKFAELRPKNCKWPGQTGFHNNCTCIIHENFKLMLEGLKNASLDEIEGQFEERPTAVSFLSLMDNYKEMTAYLICDPPTEDCYLGYCGMCPNEIHLADLFEFSELTSISYKYWEHNDISTRIDEQPLFLEKFKVALSNFLTHDFIYEKQKEFIKQLKSGPLENGTSCVLTVDFGENYTCVVQNAVQSYFWNNSQITIHPFVLYAASEVQGQPVYKTYFVISDEMVHDATTFHAFRARVISRVKVDFPKLENVDYASDGASSQYKNYRNIGNLLFHVDDYNLTARWIFTATSHGKSTCDAMSAVVKRTIRLRSLNNNETITDAEKMCKVAARELSSPTLEFLYVTKDDVAYWRDVLASRYSILMKVPAIRKHHFFYVGEDKLLVMKRYASSDRYEERKMVNRVHSLSQGTDPFNNEENPVSKLPDIGDFYTTLIGKSFQVGYVLENHSQEGYCTMQMMKKTGRGGVALVWPDVSKTHDSLFTDLLMKICPPTYNNSAGNYRMDINNLEAVRKVISTRIFT